MAGLSDAEPQTQRNRAEAPDRARTSATARSVRG